jgi:hypothetical protein
MTPQLEPKSRRQRRQTNDDGSKQTDIQNLAVAFEKGLIDCIVIPQRRIRRRNKTANPAKYDSTPSSDLHQPKPNALLLRPGFGIAEGPAA